MEDKRLYEYPIELVTDNSVLLKYSFKYSLYTVGDVLKNILNSSGALKNNEIEKLMIGLLSKMYDVNGNLKSKMDFEIKNWFCGEKYKLFRTICEDKGLIYLKDLEAFDFLSLTSYMYVTESKVSHYKKRFYELFIDAPQKIETSKVELIHKINKYIINDSNLFIPLEFIIPDVEYTKILNSEGLFTVSDFINSRQSKKSNYGGLTKLKVNEFNDVLKLLNYNFEEFYYNYFNMFKEKNDSYFILKERALNLRTLEDIAKDYNLSRQRISQKEIALINKFSVFLNLLSYYFNSVLELTENILLEDDLLKSYLKSNDDVVVFKYLASKNIQRDFVYISYLDMLSYKIKDNSIENLNSVISNLDKIILNDKNYLMDYIYNNNLDFLSIENLDSIILKQGYTKTDYYYVHKHPFLYEVCLLILKEDFKDGFKRTEEDITKFIEIGLKKFGLDLSGERVIWSKLDQPEEAILWGKSSKLHISNVVLSKVLLNKLSNYLKQELENAELISIDYFYNKYKSLLFETNIENKESLYGVLKYYFSSDYYFKKLTIKNNVTDSSYLTELLENYILEKKEPIVSIPELKNEFKVTYPMLYSAIHSSKKLISCGDSSEVLLLDSLNIPLNFTDVLKNQFEETFVDGYLNIYMLYEKYKDYYSNIGITNQSALYYVTKKYLNHLYYFNRKPNVFNDYKLVKSSISEVIENIILSKSIVNHLDIRQEFKEKYSFDVKIYNSYMHLLKNKLFLVDLDSFVHTSYVTADVKMLDELSVLLEKELKYKGCVFLNTFIKKVSNFKIEILGNDYQLNEYILMSLIEKYLSSKYILKGELKMSNVRYNRYKNVFVELK